MSLHLTGEGAANGIAVGHPFFRKPAELVKEFIPPEKIPDEIGRLRQTFEAAKSDWERALSHRRDLDEETASILESYLKLIRDRLLWNYAKQYIEQKSINAAWALEKTGKTLARTSGGQESLSDVVRKLTETLAAKNRRFRLPESFPSGSILVAKTLSPADIASLPQGSVAGILMEQGTDTSHNIILARSLGIPAVGGIRNLFRHIQPESTVILDGFHNRVIIDPTPEEIVEHQTLRQKQQILEKLFLSHAQSPAATVDGRILRIAANLELPQELGWLQEHGAEGIGLFRSESLYWDPEHPPSFEEQTALYREMVRATAPHSVTVRTFDLEEGYDGNRESRNPALGLRGIRFSLFEKEMLRTQLAALAIVSEESPLNVLLPMVTAIEEIEAVRQFLPARHRVRLGVMVETPALLWTLDEILDRVDFLAVGTNDLMQYTLAYDRNNQPFSLFLSPFHPALFRSLKQIVDTAGKRNKEVTLCGEVALDPLLLPVCIGLGFTSFSVNLRRIPRVKKWVRQLSFEKCRTLAEEILTLPDSHEIEKRLGLDTLLHLDRESRPNK